MGEQDNQQQPIRFTETEFISSLVTLMCANPDFSDIVEEPRVRMGDIVHRPDILCVYKGDKIIVECKGQTPLTLERVMGAIHQITRYCEAVPDAGYAVIAVPNKLQPTYIEHFRLNHIHVWDVGVLASLFREQLCTIKDSSVYKLLIDEPITIEVPDQFESQLKGLPRGRADWPKYQKLVANIFEHLFVPPLAKPIYETSDTAKINRRDIIMPNYCETGYWSFLREKYMADYLVIDAKNFTEKVKKTAVLQIANYLRDFGAGLFGIICSRFGAERDAIYTQREQWMMHRKLIIFLDDNDLLQMLTLKRSHQKPEEVIKQRIEDFRLGL
jgi:hypothetical protein